MAFINIIVLPDEDGTLHISIPTELREHKGSFQVEGHVLAVSEGMDHPETGRFDGYGCLQGMIWMSPDFDEPLEDFREYME